MAPWLLVAGACLFGLVMLTGELPTAQYPNDEPLHFQMVRWAVQQIHSGHLVPLDGWYPYLNFGLPQSHHYQSLPHLITAYISLIFGTDATERWTGYLLLALFPLSVYLGARLMGWSRWVAGAGAFVTPLLVSVTSYGFEHSSYLWLGGGIWSQEWGMWLLPLAWGFGWRAVNGSRGRAIYALGALAIGLTTAMHFLTGYLALLSIGVFVIVSWEKLWRRITRGVVVFAGAVLIAAWVAVPLLRDVAFSNRSEFLQNTFWLDSFGTGKVLGWLFTGEIFDHGRFPIVSLLVALGTLVCAVRFRRDVRARALLGLMTLSLILFCGRTALGPVINWLPGSSDLQLHRYIMGVHLAGDMLAGVGLVAAGAFVVRQVRSRVSWPHAGPVLAATLMVAAVVITLPAWLDRADYDRTDAQWVAAQITADQTSGAALDVLINDIKARGDGRTYAGLPGNWGKQFTVGSVPVEEYLASRDVDEVGFVFRTMSLLGDNEAYFNENDPAQYQLYNIRYVLMPRGMHPSVPVDFVDSSGQYTLWKVATTGYLQLVDTYGSIPADRSDMAKQMQPFLHSTQFRQGVLSTVAFTGGDAASATLPTAPPVAGTVGTSSDVLVDLPNGVVGGTVDAKRSAAVMLKATYDPGWQVLVDGVKTTPYMVVPGFVAVTVPAGHHEVLFQYVSYPYYGWLLLLGLLTFLALALGPWLWRTWGRNYLQKQRLRHRSPSS